MLLLESVVLTCARHFLQEHRRCYGFARIERHRGEAIALEPHGLLATIFLDLVLSERVVGRESQTVRRSKLRRQLCIHALTILIGERVAHIVWNTVQLTDSWSIRDLRASSDRTRGVIAPR